MTAQVPENLYYRGRKFRLIVNPLEYYLVRIPEQTGHLFHSKLNSHSRANWPPIPLAN